MDDNTEIIPSGTAIYRGYTSVADTIEDEPERIKSEVMILANIPEII